jgi:hypothetical protein
VNKRILWIVIILVIMALTLQACEFSVSTANISSAKLTSDSAGTTETTVFKPDQAFYYIVVLANAPDDTKVKAVWYKVDDAGTAAAEKFVEKEIVGSGSPITFNATNSNPWPAGKYKVELYLNDKLDRTQEYSVK